MCSREGFRRFGSFIKAFILTGVIVFATFLLVGLLFSFLEDSSGTPLIQTNNGSGILACFIFFMLGATILYTCMWSAADNARAGVLLGIFYFIGVLITFALGITCFALTVSNFASIKVGFGGHFLMGFCLGSLPFAGWYIWFTYRAIGNRRGPDDWEEMKYYALQFLIFLGICAVPNIALSYALKKAAWVVWVLNMIAAVIPLGIAIYNRIHRGSVFMWKYDKE